MVSREMIEIILKAEDQASKVFKDNEQSVKRFADAAKQANSKAGISSQQFAKNAQQASQKVNDIVKSSERVGQIGPKQFNKYSDSVQKSIVNFNRLDRETQNMLRYMSQMSSKGRETFVGISTKAQEAIGKFQALENETRTWGNTFDFTKTKMQLMGTDVDSLKGKVQVFGASFSSYVTPKVQTLANSIKSKITSALSTVRSKVESLGSAFSGLGGMISSAIGMLGMSSITDLTVGLSMGRERMTALTQATTGSAQAADNLINGYQNLNYEFKDLNGNSTHTFMGLDEMTNHSLVGLDALGQAMSNFKMATGATNDQLAYVAPVINDIGQRAILMGKSSDEALGLMQGAAQGLNGNFMSLKRTFGVTKEKLEELGWSGAADDVEGYTDALQKYLEKGGKMDEMMDTSVGHLETLKKNFRIAGRHVGDMFTPYIDQAVVSLNDLNDKCPGLFEGLVGIAGGVSMFATLAPTISPMLVAFDNLTAKSKSVLRFLGLMEAEEGALTLATLRESAAQKISAATKWLSGAATAAYGTIVGVLTGEIGLATVAQQIWNAVMAANPIGIILIAVAALAVAVYELGKMWGWWSDIGTMLDAIKAGLTRLWDAFINNPNVQGLIKGIGDAWVSLQEASKPVIDWLSGIWEMIFPQSATEQWDATRIIIEAIGLAFTVLTMPLRGLYELLQLLYPYMLQFYNTTLVPLGSFLTSVLNPAWQFLGDTINAISPFISNLMNAFQSFQNGQIALPQFIMSVMTQLWNIYNTILTRIGQAVFSWGSSIVSRGINAASRFVSGIINWISSLPGRFGSYLRHIILDIASAGASWISTGISKASSLVSGVVTQVSQLPGKVYTEFMNIGSRIMEAGSDLVQKATEIGKNIVNGLLNAMGIHSPGIIQEKVVLEFVNMVGRVGSKIKSAYDTAKSMGEAIVEGFGNPSLETNTDNMLPNEAALNTSIGASAQATASIDTSGVTASNADVVGSYDNLANMTGAALQTMVNKDQLAYATIRNNDAATLSQMSTTMSQKMSSMTSTVRSNMDNIVAKNKSGMNTVKNTTSTQLNNIVSKTKNANTQMIKAWGTMKDGIINAADKIRSDSTKHFDKLSGTIGSFYGKLKNPSRWGAGGPATSSRGHSSSGFSKISSAIRNASLPTYLSANQIRTNPLIAGKFGDYVTRDPKTNKFSVIDLIRYGALNLVGKGAGAYSNIPSPNVKLIKDTSNEWDMKGPLVGKFQTNHGFKVKEFLSGVPQIGYDVFRSIAEEVFSQTSYEFYYDNDHHGNWVNAFNAGSMNCLHGAQALIALAQTMGLSGGLVHGHWTDSTGTYGHYFANIAGHKMDVTGWQQRRTWTPSASAGPAPRSIGFKEALQAIIDILKDDPKPQGGSGDTLSGEITIIHDFKHLPDGVSAEDVAKLIEDSATNDNFIKKLVRNIKFQNLDAEEKAKLERRANKAKGV